MKKITFERFGVPRHVVQCVEVPALSDPSAWEVSVKITSSCVNPSDISVLRGHYGTLPSRFPATLGLEGAGIITAVGSSVTNFKAGDNVLIMANDNWVEAKNVPASLVIKSPDDMDLEQVSMVKVNSVCAHVMLRDFGNLAKGSYVIQSAPLSAVGRMVIGFAKARGIRTINVVRRKKAIDEVTALGGDVAVMDSENLNTAVRELIGNAPIEMALDAVAGVMPSKLADCIEDGATLLNYGMLSGEPCQLRADQTIFRDIRLRGFWLTKLLVRMKQNERNALINEAFAIMRENNLRNEVAERFSLDAINEAIAKSEDPDRRGKIILTPNAA